MSNTKCCVAGCENSAGSSETLHKFPNPEKNNELFKTWLYSVGGDILRLENDHIFKYRRVCHSHFEGKYLCRNNRISNDAVLTLNMREPLSLPKRTLTERNYQSSEPISKEPSTSVATLLYSGKVEDVEMKENIDPVTLTGHLNPVTLQQHSDGQDMQMKEYPTSQKEKAVRIVAHKQKRASATAADQVLYKKLVQVGVELSKCQSINKKQTVKIRSLKNITTNPHFLKTLDNFSSTAKMLTMMHHQLINNANIKPGLTENFKNQIKKATEKMPAKERLCVVLFDEMSLKASVAFNERKGTVLGFVSNGQETQADIADHAQVFMVHGLLNNYKQPVSYTFSQAATKGPELAKQLKAVITELQDAGLIVVATVCDQGTNNVNCLKLLIQETRGDLLRKGQELRGNIFEVNGHEIVLIYDPAHLIKGIRNNLLNKDLKYTENGNVKTAKWHFKNKFRKK